MVYHGLILQEINILIYRMRSSLHCFASEHFTSTVIFERSACVSLQIITVIFAIFYIRMNDWVKEIRDASAELLMELLSKCPLYDIIRDTSIFERLHFANRRSEKHFDEIFQ